jgi:hypothetical protein
MNKFDKSNIAIRNRYLFSSASRTRICAIWRPQWKAELLDAGIFSNAMDVAKMMQLFLQKESVRR